MFQSIAFIKYLGYDDKTKSRSYEFKLTDSDFSCIVRAGAVGVADANAAAVLFGVAVAFAPEVGAVIQEYSKRNLNVAENLIKFFLYCEKKYGNSIAEQIEWAENDEPTFTPQIKADLQKYLLLL